MTNLLDVEVNFIATLFHFPESFFKVGFVKPYMLSSSPLQTIYSNLTQELSNGKFDFELFLLKLENKGVLQDVGGEEYLRYIYSQLPNIEAVSEYANLIVNMYKARCLRAIGSKLLSTTPETAADTQIKITSEISQLSTVGEFQENIINAFDLGDIVISELEERAKNPGNTGISWGINSLDVVTGGKMPGTLYVIGGRPGQGKTAFACNSMLADARSGVPILLIEREMTAKQIYERFISIFTGIPINNIRLGFLKPGDLDKIKQAVSTLKTYPIYIDTTFTEYPQSRLETTISTFVREKGVKVVYVDHIQLLPIEEDQTRELSNLANLFKRLSNGLGISMVVLSQLNRMVETRNNKRPLLSDLRQSGGIEEAADTVIMLYRDEYYDQATRTPNTIEMNIAKNRSGMVGTTVAHFEKETNKIYD
jgi:replicative DNA helicase